MRRILFVLVAAFLANIVTASPTGRNERFDVVDPWSSTGVGAFAGSGFGGGFPFGQNFPFAPSFPYYVSPFSSYPFGPQFYQPPWYQGANVCKQEKEANMTPEIKEIMGNSGSSFQYRQQAEHCQGSDGVMSCSGSKLKNGEMVLYKTIYQCCVGFSLQYKPDEERRIFTYGCYENSKDKDVKPREEENLEENTRYKIIPYERQQGPPVQAESVAQSVVSGVRIN